MSTESRLRLPAADRIERTDGQVVLAGRAAETMSRLHRAAGGSPADAIWLETATRRLIEARSRGDVCVMLDAEQDAALSAALQRSPIAAAAGPDIVAHPLVYATGRLYAWRDWQAERSLATQLVSRAGPIITSPLIEPGTDDDGLNAGQRRALEVSIRQRMLILTGGPGTGKTHCLAAIVRAFARSDPTMSIAVAAPTGKATARLQQAIVSLTGDLPGLSLDAMTLHRLLAYNPSLGFRRHARNRLAYDLVIVDECSMVDSQLARQLLEALRDSTRLILAGDRDQLSSVQAGAFFGSICASTHPAMMAGRVVLEENYRQIDAPDILAWARAVRDGSLQVDRLPDHDGQVRVHDRAVAAVAASETSDDPLIRLVPDLVERSLTHLLPLVDRAEKLSDAGAAADLLAEFQAVQILTLMRSGPIGANVINRHVSESLRRQSGWLRQRWYPGRLVVLRRNAAHRGLYNGDIGLCVRSWAGDGLRVLFAGVQGVRDLSPATLPLHDDAFALTVHQAQGSDFDEVLLMPAPAGHPLNTREGLYTGITRARRQVHLFAPPATLADAAMRPSARESGLLDALDEYSKTLGADPTVMGGAGG